MHDQIAEEVEHATGIFFAETAQRAEGAPRIEWKYRF